jgi:hypothetical protein
MTTTLKHPMIREAEQVILQAADMVAQCFDRAGHFGIPEAVAATAATLPEPVRVVAERALVNAGLDVWWSELLCIDGADAAERMRAVLPIKATELYGPNAEAILGLLSACGRIDAAHLNGLANLVHRAEWELFADACIMADAYGRTELLMQVCEDVHFATAHYATTPAGVERRLRGIRALECTAAMLVLRDVLSPDMKNDLAAPVYAMLYPDVVAL